MHVSYLHLRRPHIETEQILIEFPITDYTKLRHEIQFPLCFASDNTAQESPNAFLRASPALPALCRNGNCCEKGSIYGNVKCSTKLILRCNFQGSRHN
jgi:hypothetical protein